MNLLYLSITDINLNLNLPENPIVRASTHIYISYDRTTMTFVEIFSKLIDRSDESCSLTGIK